MALMKTRLMETKQHTGQFILHAAAVGLLSLAAVLPVRADYSSTVMSLNPLGCWRLNEPTAPAPNYALGTVTNYGSLGAAANGTYYHSSILQEPGVIAGDPCVKLDGKTQYIEVPYSPVLNTNGPFSVEFWANQTVVAAGAKSGVMSFDGNTGFLFYSDNNDPHWGFRVFYGTGRTYVKDTGPDNQPNTWYHVVGVFDGTLVHIYVNGVENATPQPIGGDGYVPNTTAPLRIGAGNPAGAPSLLFPGWIDEVAVYPYALSPSQITAHYTTATTNPAGYAALIVGDKPTGYWRFNEPPLPPEPTPVTVAVANLGRWGDSADGAFTAGGVLSGVPGVPYRGFEPGNTACEFTGSSDSYIEIPPQNLFTDSWTVICWAKRNGVSQYWSMLFSNPNDLGQPEAGPSHPVTGVGFGNGGNPSGSYNDMRMYWAGTDANTGNYGVTPNPPLYMPDQEWTFVAMVVSPTNIVLYKNLEAAIHTPAWPYGPHDFGLVPSFIGKKQKYYGWDSGSEVNGFRGTIDEVAVFDRALTADEVMLLYGAGVELPPRIVQQPQAPSKVYEGDPTLTLNVVVQNLSATPATYQWTKDGVAIPGATNATLAFGVATVSASGGYAVVVSNPNGSVTSDVVPISVVTPPPGHMDYAQTVLSLKPVAYYRLNEAADADTTPNAGSWGAGADGTYLQGAKGGAPGVPYPGFGAGNYASEFPGVAGLRDGTVGNPDTPGSCIRIPPQSGVVDEMTITCWIKRDGDQWVWRGLVTQRDGDDTAPNGAGNGTGLTLGANGSSPNIGQELRILWNKGDVYWQYDPQLNTPNQQWAFCAVVFTPTNRTVYLNTRAASRIVPENETTMPAGPHDWSVNPIFIGYDARGPYYGENSAFKGLIDEVAIFDRALTTDEIIQMYAAAEVPPIIVVQPQAPPPPVYEGTSLSLSVKCDEYASVSPLHYQWTKNGVPMPGQTAAELVFSDLAMSDSGNYAVIVTNTFGAVTSSVVALTVVSGPPVIVKSPDPVWRYPGAQATFKVGAVGSGPLSYQWSLNGIPISGATSPVYAVFDLGPENAGTYSVLVSNPYGSTNVSTTLTLLTPSKLAVAITERSPLGYWCMDETSGTVAYDYWGERNGTCSSGVTNNAPGPEPPALKGFNLGNKAYAFDGGRGYVDVPMFGQIAPSMTIIAWIKPDAVQVDFTGLVFTRGGGGTVCGLDYQRYGQLGYTWNDAPQSYNWESGLYPTPDQWNFVALVVEPTQATLYLDDGSGLWSAVNYLNHGTATWSGVRFGYDPGGPGARYYKGGMDDVAVYAYALSPEEIENIRKAGFEGVYTPAKKYRWKGADGAAWSVAGNWNDTLPGANDIAVFSDSPNAGATVNLDTDVTVGGLRFNNKVANQTIASTGGKTLALSGGSVDVQAGKLTISCPIDATANGLTKIGSGVLNIAGPMQVTYQPPNQWTFHQVSGIELSGTGSWTIVDDFPMLDVVGTVIVNDNATLDWSSCVAGIALKGGETGLLIQNGGVVKGQPTGTGWACCSGPGLILGDNAPYFGGTGPSYAEYQLNGGVLLVASIYNVNGAWDHPPAPPNGSAVFRFNGGILRATQGDSTDEGAIKEGCTNLIGNLSHAYVGLGGAKIDVASYNCGINQALEHDPALGDAADGGLHVMSSGGPGTLALYKPCSFTGPLVIDANVKVHLGYEGDQRVASVFIGGVDQGVGTFGAGHLNPGGVFTGPGTLTVQPALPPTPVLPASSIRIGAGGVPTFADVPTTAGYTYWLTYKNELSDPAWIRIGAGTPGGGNKTFIDTVTPYPAYRFYRLEVQ